MSWGQGDTLIVPEESGPAQWLRDHLRDHLAARYPRLGYGLRLPESWKPKGDPFLAVFDDSGGMSWPVTTNPTLRVTVWSDSLTLSRDVAAYALGTTLSRRVEGIATILPGTRVLDARDTNNGGIMASYTVRARVRTTLVTETHGSDTAP